jgi:hypothetical protein
MYSTPVDLSFSYLRSAVEASLDIKKNQVDPNKGKQKKGLCRNRSETEKALKAKNTVCKNVLYFYGKYDLRKTTSLVELTALLLFKIGCAYFVLRIYYHFIFTLGYLVFRGIKKTLPVITERCFFDSRSKNQREREGLDW